MRPARKQVGGRLPVTHLLRQWCLRRRAGIRIVYHSHGAKWLFALASTVRRHQTPKRRYPIGRNRKIPRPGNTSSGCTTRSPTNPQDHLLRSCYMWRFCHWRPAHGPGVDAARYLFENCKRAAPQDAVPKRNGGNIGPPGADIETTAYSGARDAAMHQLYF